MATLFKMVLLGTGCGFTIAITLCYLWLFLDGLWKELNRK